MVYFDNAATTYPKPPQVINALSKSLVKFGANPGRSGYDMAINTSAEIYSARLDVARFFNLSDEQGVIFTQNCTTALNTVIKGLAEKGSHFVISNLEHNAVLRPLETLKLRGICDYSTAEYDFDDDKTVANFKEKIRDNTVAIICSGASNVFGVRLPVKRLSELAHDNGLVFVLDAAQTAGVVDIDIERDGIDYMCVAAHKGLYAPMSVGILIINNSRHLNTLIEGGTGTYSAHSTQPEDLPERFEAGTLSVPLISALRQGVKFVADNGIDRIYRHEMSLINELYRQMSGIENVELYVNPLSADIKTVPVLSFNIKGMSSEQTAQKLAENNIAVRAGFHCAFSAHKAFRTERFGTVRISPCIFNKMKDVNILLNYIFKFAK